jgi:hypothetical protein
MFPSCAKRMRFVEPQEASQSDTKRSPILGFERSTGSETVFTPRKKPQSNMFYTPGKDARI